MTERAPLNFDQPLHKIIEALAEGNIAAKAYLEELAQYCVAQRRPILPMLWDFEDMQMRGLQIASAVRHARVTAPKNANPWLHLAQLCTERNADMVEVVNQAVPECQARQGGIQLHINPVDVAVNAAVAAGADATIVGRLDEGAEQVHNFFLQMLQRMQATGKFTANLRVNLGLENGYCMVFVIAAAELLDKDGKPVTQQPTKEGERQQEELRKVVDNAASPEYSSAGTCTHGVPLNDHCPRCAQPELESELLP